MDRQFTDLVEEVRHLPSEEMAELKSVIERELIESRREEIHKNHLEGVELWKQGKLKPSSDVDEIMRRLDAK
jgi:hypothetical protein